MNERQIERQLAKCRRQLGILRNRAARSRFAEDPALEKALADFVERLDGLAELFEDAATSHEERTGIHARAVSDAQRYEDLFRHGPDGYLVTDERGVIRDVNAVVERWLGRSRRYLAGKPMLSLVTQADGDLFLRYLADLRERRVPIDDRPLRFADQNFDGSISANLEPRGEGLEIRWTIRDVTARNRAERALRASDERNRAALELAGEGILSTDPTGVIRSCNTTLCEMFGYEADELEGHPVDLLGVTREALLTPGSTREWMAVRRNGSRFPIQISVKEAQPEEGPLVSTVRDLSVERSLEIRLKAATAATAMAEERERRALAADLHDDVGQLLSLAGMKVGMMRGAAGGAATRLRDELADLISRAHQRTESLMFQLSPPVLRDMGLTAAIEWLAEDLERAYGLRVHVEHDGEPPLDEPTRVTVFRSLRELLINAARHAQTHTASAKIARGEGHLVAEVEDRGIGFDASSIGSQSFGLLSTRERVEALGGIFEIDSEIGGGTRARIAVALADSPPPQDSIARSRN